MGNERELKELESKISRVTAERDEKEALKRELSEKRDTLPTRCRSLDSKRPRLPSSLQNWKKNCLNRAALRFRKENSLTNSTGNARDLKTELRKFPNRLRCSNRR